MAKQKTYKKSYQQYFDMFAKRYLKDDQPDYADIKVLWDESTVQTETTWEILDGITFNEKDGLLNIKCENIDCMILNPHEIHVDELEEDWFNSMEVIEKDGVKLLSKHDNRYMEHHTPAS